MNAEQREAMLDAVYLLAAVDNGPTGPAGSGTGGSGTGGTGYTGPTDPTGAAGGTLFPNSFYPDRFPRPGPRRILPWKIR